MRTFESRAHTPTTNFALMLAVIGRPYLRGGLAGGLTRGLDCPPPPWELVLGACEDAGIDYNVHAA
jgi:hypothetical protein